MIVEEKTCLKCGVEKPRECFYARRGACITCVGAVNRERYRANPEKVAAINKAWRDANPGRKTAINKAWAKANPGRVAAINKTWVAANRTKRRTTVKAWRLANPAKVNAQTARRVAAKLQATPAWANTSAIAAVYELATTLTELTGIPHQVDHQVPLRSKLVCGFHVEHNLEVVPAKDNMSKGNRSWPDMP